jgi:PAS domain S-box-containing protein
VGKLSDDVVEGIAGTRARGGGEIAMHGTDGPTAGLLEALTQLRQQVTGLELTVAEERRAAEDAQRALRTSRASEQVLRISEVRYRRLFESAKDGILILDAATGRILDANPYLLNLLGRSLAELRGSKMWELSPFRDIAASEAAFRDLQSKKYSRYEDLPLEDSAGRLHQVEFVSNVYQEAEVQVIQCNIRDITERVAAEHERRRLTRRLELLLDSTREGIYGVDMQGRCTFVNRSGASLLGWAPEDLLGRNMHDAIHHARPDGSRYPASDCPLHRALGAGEECHGADEVLWRRDGTSFPVEYASHPMEDAGVTAGSVVTFVDVTERNSLEEQFRQAQKMEAVGRLAGGVAHDFNNLLTVISGYSEMLMHQLASTDPGREGLGEISRAADRAASLTRQLLAFSRKQVLAPEPLDLNAVVRNSRKMFERLLGEDLEVALTLEPGLACARADRGQLEQVLMNLAVNARDAMPQGGKLAIETATVELDDAYCRKHAEVVPGRYAMLAMSDTGTGMDAATRQRIFEPFFTTKTLGKGTWLGLAMVYGFIKQSGGHVEVHSDEGRGSVFRLYLPVTPEAGPSGESKKPLGSLPNGHETILLAEDEVSVRALTRRILGRCGYHVIDAGNGVEAIRLSEEHRGPIHLLLSDVVMPVLGGRKLAEKLSASRPGIRVLFLSGYADDAVVREGGNGLARAFLQKPFTPSALAVKVREVLDTKR